MKTRTAVLVTLMCLATLLTSTQHMRVSGAASQTGDAVLTVANGLANQPGGVNPLSGAPLALLTESFESLLRKTHLFDGQPSAVRAWTAACATRSPACRNALGNLEEAAVAEGQMVPGGRMTFPGVPPGTYYLFAFTLSVQNAQTLVWDLRVDLKPGANAVTLDQRNTALLEAVSELAKPSAARSQPAAGSQPCQGADAPKAASPGARADSALSVVGTGYVYTYTKTNQFGQVVDSFTERGNFSNTTLYLLDEDADSILQQAGVQPGLLGSRLATFTLMDAGTQVENVPGMAVITSLLGQGSREEVAEFTRQRKAEFECVMKAIRAHSVAEMTTNAAARGIFPRVPAGTYYLFGRFYRIKKPARGGGVLWNLRVTLKPGQNALRLSVDNAALK